jgi:hypothetical protein
MGSWRWKFWRCGAYHNPCLGLSFRDCAPCSHSWFPLVVFCSTSGSNLRVGCFRCVLTRYYCSAISPAAAVEALPLPRLV